MMAQHEQRYGVGRWEGVLLPVMRLYFFLACFLNEMRLSARLSMVIRCYCSVVCVVSSPDSSQVLSQRYLVSLGKGMQRTLLQSE
jgi:hypothetical protein